MKSNHYEILGVARDATGEQIHTAYRRMARRHHPDVGGDPDEFKKIAEAYETLSDSHKREIYDKECGFFIWNIQTNNVQLIMPLCVSDNHKKLLEELVNTEWEIRR